MSVRTRHAVHLTAPDDVDGWRAGVRPLLAARVPASDIEFVVAGEQGSLFAQDAERAALAGGATVNLPAAFWPLARTALLHSDPERFAIHCELAQKLAARELSLHDQAHPLVRRVEALAKAVRRDMHKMRAFVRFREMGAGDEARFVAWFEPDHHIVRANAAFFVERFANMRWSILTPALCIHWDGKVLSESAGATRGDAPAGDPVEDIWKRYYASIFNPARIKIGAMLSEMPKKYWHNMPETALIPGLVAEAQTRTRAMLAASAAMPGEDMPSDQLPLLDPRTDPASGVLPADARAAAMAELGASARADAAPEGAASYGDIVWGEGPLDAALMLVGEQPGDQEDLAGRPFVGPAGQLLDRALGDAGIDRSRLYLTNAFKRFKHLPQGKRRLHQTPTAGEIDHARWWLTRERGIIRPRVVLALGASAARGVLGKTVPVERSRGNDFTLEDGGIARVTGHPSAILRVPDQALAADKYRALVADLSAAQALAG